MPSVRPPLELADALPFELVVKALSYCSAPTVGRAACACRVLHAASTEPDVWDSTTLPARVLSQRMLGRLGRTKDLTLTHSCGRWCHSTSFARPTLTALGCGSLLDGGVRRLVAGCPSLRRLDLSGMAHVTPGGLLAVFGSCTSLEQLVLRGCVRVTTGLAAVCAGASPPAAVAGLRRLDVAHTDTADADAVALLGLAPALGTLSLAFCERLTDAALDALPPTVRSLDLVGCCRLSFGRLREACDALGTDERGESRVRCDDCWIHKVEAGALTPAQAISGLLAAHRAEEVRVR